MTNKKDDKSVIGKIPLKRLSVSMLDIEEEREQLNQLMPECFPGALHERPIVGIACQHSVILRHAHEIAVRGTDTQRRQAIVALAEIVLGKGV